MVMPVTAAKRETLLGVIGQRKLSQRERADWPAKVGILFHGGAKRAGGRFSPPVRNLAIITSNFEATKFGSYNQIAFYPETVAGCIVSERGVSTLSAPGLSPAGISMVTVKPWVVPFLISNRCWGP